MGVGDEVLLEFEVVLDDPVMNDSNALETVVMRVSILVGWAAVGCPTTVGDGKVSVLWRVKKDLSEFG